MRFNSDWIAHLNSIFGHIDSFKIYDGVYPSSPGGLPLSVDLTTLSLDENNITVITGETDAKGLYLTPDRLSFVVLATNGDFKKYTMSSARDYGSATLSQSGTSPGPGIEGGFDFNADMSRIFVADDLNNTIVQADLSTPEDLTTIGTYNGFSITGDLTSVSAVKVFENGNKMLVLSAVDEKIGVYSLSTSNDVTSASFESSFNLSSLTVDYWKDIFPTEDGAIYVVGGDNVIYEILTTDFDLSTASFGDTFTDTSGYAYAVTGLYIDKDNGVFDIMNTDSMAVAGTVQTNVDVQPVVDFTSVVQSDQNNTFLPVQNSANVDMVWQGSTINYSVPNNATMVFFIAEVGNGTESFLIDGTIGVTGSGADLEFPVQSVSSGDVLTISSLSFTFNDAYL